MNFYLTAIVLGLGFSSLAFGIYISMRIFNIPDITTDGSFTLGGAVTAILLSNHLPASTALLISPMAGFVAGVTTGFIHARLKVNALLSGILVMTALYSVNLGIMQRSNIPLINVQNIFSIFSFTTNNALNNLLLMIFVSAILWAILYFLLRTDFGLAMRATGNNETMMRSLGTNTDRMKIIGLGLANSFVAFSGSMIAQLQGYADINMGIGIVILGLGSVIIGEMIMLFAGRKSIGWQLGGVIVGSILFRMILALALSWGIDPVYLKLVVAALVLACITLPAIRKRIL